jgi:hypothetical protein
MPPSTSNAAPIPGPTCSLHSLLTRLLDDHQRMYPHHADLCPLCQDTKRMLDKLAIELPPTFLF